MLTGTQVRVRFARQRVIPVFLSPDDPSWLEIAERLLDQFRGREGTTRGALADEADSLFGGAPNQPVYQGLARLLENRCEFAVEACGDPAEVRRHVFETAAKRRR